MSDVDWPQGREGRKGSCLGALEGAIVRATDGLLRHLIIAG